jgi:hypothetical protein
LLHAASDGIYNNYRNGKKRKKTEFKKEQAIILVAVDPYPLF